MERPLIKKEETRSAGRLIGKGGLAKTDVHEKREGPIREKRKR